MPAWTLRLVAFAGLVALLGRLPAFGSVPDAFLLATAAVGLAAAAAYIPVAFRAARASRRVRPTFPHRPLTPLTLRFRSAHGADA